MAFGPGGERDARLGLLVEAAASYHLDPGDARSIVDGQVATIRDQWDEVGEQAELTAPQRAGLFERQFLNPRVLE